MAPRASLAAAGVMIAALNAATVVAQPASPTNVAISAGASYRDPRGWLQERRAWARKAGRGSQEKKIKLSGERTGCAFFPRPRFVLFSLLPISPNPRRRHGCERKLDPVRDGERELRG